jgi:hypothetical protein
MRSKSVPRKSGIGGEDLRLLRETVARPIMSQLHAYLLRIWPELLPKGDAGKAVAYILKNWLTLARYLDDGDLAIDNNRTERSLRGLCYFPTPSGVNCLPVELHTFGEGIHRNRRLVEQLAFVPLADAAFRLPRISHHVVRQSTFVVCHHRFCPFIGHGLYDSLQLPLRASRL